jgi:transcriptional regulator with XRE-family HTH domain
MCIRNTKGVEIMKISGNRIELARMSRGLTLRELGNMANVTAGSISAIERGVSKPRPKTAKLLCDALKMDFNELFIVAEVKKELKSCE